MQPIYNFFGGRSTTFAWVFTIIGSIGFFLGLLSGTQFVALAGAVHSFVIMRAISEDKFCAGKQSGAAAPSAESS